MRARWGSYLLCAVATAVAIPAFAASTDTKKSAQGAPAVAERKPIIGYFTAWGIYGRKYFARNVKENGSAEKLSHLNYAFANISPDLKCAVGDAWADYQKPFTAEESVDGVADSEKAPGLKGNFNQIRKLKALYPRLKVLISVGGYSWSEKFSNAALTEASRKAFVGSCVDMFVKGEIAPDVSAAGLFDGIDVDWEFPGACGRTCDHRPEDTRNFTLLMAEFRAQLDALAGKDGKRYLTSIATSARPHEYGKIELGRVSESLDFVNLMAYDFHLATETTANFHSPLFESAKDPSRDQKLWTDAAVAGHLKGGVPAGKLILGVPFYGRGWEGVPPGPAKDGLYQTVTGPAPARFDKGLEETWVLEAASAPKHRHEEAQALWTYDPKTQVFWSYDDSAALARKAEYVKAKGLGGVMFWELSGDDASGTLIASLYNKLE